MPRVTIVGAGNMGRGIGTRAAAGGNEVEILDRDPMEVHQLAAELDGGATALEPRARFGGQVVVFAIYYPDIKDAVQQYGDQLAGKVWSTSPTRSTPRPGDRLATPPGTSSAEEVAQLVPQGTPVVKASNTTFAGTLVAGEVGGQQLDVLIAGDDAAAKETVSQLVSDGGLRPSTSARSAGPSSSSSSASSTSRCSSRSASASAGSSSSSCPKGAPPVSPSGQPIVVPKTRPSP